MIILPFLLACDNAGKLVTMAVPAIEEVKPSWANPVDCEDNRAAVASTSKKAFRDSFDCDVDQKEPIVIEGTTKGGVQLIGDNFYQEAACTPAKTHFFRKAPEAIYQLNVAPNTMAEIRLDSNCADLDPFAFTWQKSSAPKEAHAATIRECEMDNDVGDGKLVLTTVHNAAQYLVGVDGKNGEQGNFRLTISCRSYR